MLHGHRWSHLSRGSESEIMSKKFYVVPKDALDRAIVLATKGGDAETAQRLIGIQSTAMIVDDECDECEHEWDLTMSTKSDLTYKWKNGKRVYVCVKCGLTELRAA